MSGSKLAEGVQVANERSPRECRFVFPNRPLKMTTVQKIKEIEDEMVMFMLNSFTMDIDQIFRLGVSDLYLQHPFRP